MLPLAAVALFAAALVTPARAVCSWTGSACAIDLQALYTRYNFVQCMIDATGSECDPSGVGDVATRCKVVSVRVEGLLENFCIYEPVNEAAHARYVAADRSRSESGYCTSASFTQDLDGCGGLLAEASGFETFRDMVAFEGFERQLDAHCGAVPSEAECAEQTLEEVVDGRGEPIVAPEVNLIGGNGDEDGADAGLRTAGLLGALAAGAAALLL